MNWGGALYQDKVVTLKYDHLLGREYEPGRVHCYSLVRDFFKSNFQLELGNYAVPHDWDADEIDLIGEIYQSEGFIKLSDWTLKDLRPGDVLCVGVRTKNANHFVINVGDNLLLHHPLNQRSEVVPMRDFWRNRTNYVVRHPDVPYTPIVYPTKSILELARERYQVQASS